MTLPKARSGAVADTLTIPECTASQCEVQFADRRYDRSAAAFYRPVRVTLSNDAFEATFLAAPEDLVRMRNWLDRAIAAIEQQDGLSPLEMGAGSDG